MERIRDPEDLPHREVTTDAPSPRSAARTVGFSGVRVFAGHVYALDEDYRLSGDAKWTTFSKLVVDTPIIAASVRHFSTLVGRASWRIEPSSGSESAKRAAEVVARAIDRSSVSLAKASRRLSMHRFMGFAMAEWVAGPTTADGVVTLGALLARPQRTIEKWQLDRRGDVVFAVQKSPNSQREMRLPRNRLVYVRDDTLSDAPDGYPLLRATVRPSRELRQLEDLEGIGFERDLRGTPIGRAPLSELERLVEDGELTAAAKDQLVASLTSFLKIQAKGRETSLLIDSATYREDDDSATPSTVPMWDVDLMRGSSTNQQQVAAAIMRKQGEIARILGTDGLLLGNSREGSFALSADKSDGFRQNVESALDDVAESYSRDLCRPLATLNGYDEEDAPIAVSSGVERLGPMELTKALRDLSLAGAEVGRDDPATAEVLLRLGLPGFEDVVRAEDAAQHDMAMELSREGARQRESDAQRRTASGGRDPRDGGPADVSRIA